MPKRRLRCKMDMILQIPPAKNATGGEVSHTAGRSGALAGSAPKVVLDLSRVAFIDSAGLASILSLVKGLPEGGDLRIAGARDAVRAVFRLTRLDKVLALHDTVEDAVAAVEAR